MATKKSKMGRPTHKPTIHSRSKVIEFVCAGFRRSDIANYFRMDEETLNKYYKHELDQSLMHRTARLSRNVYLDALNGCKSSRTFWLTHRGGWYPAKAPDKISDETPPWLSKFIDIVSNGNNPKDEK
jgi:hypothetical protein